MVIKVEIYFEIENRGEEPIPTTVKAQLTEKVWNDVSKQFSLKASIWKDLVVAKKLTTEQIHEKIRTAK